MRLRISPLSLTLSHPLSLSPSLSASDSSTPLAWGILPPGAPGSNWAAELCSPPYIALKGYEIMHLRISLCLSLSLSLYLYLPLSLSP